MGFGSAARRFRRLIFGCRWSWGRSWFDGREGLPAHAADSCVVLKHLLLARSAAFGVAKRWFCGTSAPLRLLALTARRSSGWYSRRESFPHVHFRGGAAANEVKVGLRVDSEVPCGHCGHAKGCLRLQVRWWRLL